MRYNVLAAFGVALGLCALASAFYWAAFDVFWWKDASGREGVDRGVVLFFMHTWALGCGAAGFVRLITREPT